MKKNKKFENKEKNLDFIAKNKYGIKTYQDININNINIINKFNEKKIH